MLETRGMLDDPDSRRGCLVSAVVLVVVLASVLFVVSGAFARTAVALFPGGTVVPVTELRASGPVVGDHAVQLFASTSVADLRTQVLRGDRECANPDPHPGWTRRCWGDVQVSAAMLLVATVAPFCTNYERVGILHGRALRIRVVDVCYVRPGEGTLTQPTYALLGVPLERLPRGLLTVALDDDRADPASTSVVLS